jgi:predicted PolB exonuclease-like 3'-5' exonuclease
MCLCVCPLCGHKLAMANSNVFLAFHAHFNSIKRKLGIISTKLAKKVKTKSKVNPTESQCWLLDSCRYHDFQDLLFFPNSIKSNNFVSRFAELKRDFMDHNGGKKPYKGKAYIFCSLFLKVCILLIIHNCNSTTCIN